MFDLLDDLTSQVLLPLGGLARCVRRRALPARFFLGHELLLRGAGRYSAYESRCGSSLQRSSSWPPGPHFLADDDEEVVRPLLVAPTRWQRCHYEDPYQWTRGKRGFQCWLGRVRFGQSLGEDRSVVVWWGPGLPFMGAS